MQIPKLRFKNFNDEWKSTKIEKVCEICYGKSQVDIECKNGKYNILGTGGIIGTTNHFLYNKPSVLIGRKGTIDKPKFIDIPFWTVDTLFYTKINDNIIKPKFFYYCISHIDLKKYNEATGVPSLSTSILNKINIFIPSLEEQTKIANFLSLIDRKIELQEKLVENLKLYKKGLLKKVFSNNLGWKSAKLGDLGNTYTGLSGKSKEDFKNGNSKFITYMNVFSNCISNNQQLENISINSNETQNKVKYGDIFFTTSSETPKEVGMSSVWLFNDDNIYLNSFCFGFRLNNITNFNIKFLAYLLRSYLIRKKIIFLAQGSTRYNISKNELMNLEILYPSIEQQNQIANLFTSLDKKIELETKKLQDLKTYKKGLLQKMFI